MSRMFEVAEEFRPVRYQGSVTRRVFLTEERPNVESLAPLLYESVLKIVTNFIELHVETMFESSTDHK